MSAKPTIAFVTYARLYRTAQIGVLKRVLRIVQHLTNRYDVRLLHFGVIPDDPLVAAVLPLLDVRIVNDEDPSRLPALLDGASQLVFGEAPLSGMLRRVYRIAQTKNVLQASIDNHYGDFVLPQFRREWPLIRTWLLLGLDCCRREHSGAVFDIVPPLLDAPSTNHGSRDRITILGYDADTLHTGMALLDRLPRNVQATIHTTDAFIGPARAWAEGTRRPIHVAGLPSEEMLAEVLAHSSFVVCKNGFQQMVESLFLGAPVVARVCPGGVAEDLIAPAFRRWIRYVDDQRDVGRVLFDAALWLGSTSPMPWSALATQRPVSGARYAADRLAALLDV